MVVSFHFIGRGLQAEKKLLDYEEAKKNDEKHEMDKADSRATKTKNRTMKKQNHVRGKDYKTSERRQHVPKTHNIQQPMK